MTIIKAEAADLGAVKAITAETISAVYPRYYPKGAVDFFLAHHSDKNIYDDILNGQVYLLLNNSKAAGTVTIKENEICRLFVLPSFQKMGFGRALMDFAEDKISENYSEIRLSASLPAKNIYIKRGYREFEYNSIHTDNGDFLCYDNMKKEI